MPVQNKHSLCFCRDDKIRTCDLYVPNVARYQLRHIPSNFAAANLLFFHKMIKEFGFFIGKNKFSVYHKNNSHYISYWISLEFTNKRKVAKIKYANYYIIKYPPLGSAAWLAKKVRKVKNFAFLAFKKIFFKK